MRNFLTSSRGRVPEPGLQGYAWDGVDLLIDDDGLAGQGSQVLPGGDGSYVTVAPTAGGVRVGTDRIGHTRLFLYRRGADWVVGTSFIEVVERAASYRWPVTIDRAMLNAFTMEGALTNQLVTHETSVRQVRMLPTHLEAVITRGAFRRKLDLRPAPAPPIGSYRALLERGVSEMVGRMGTLLNAPRGVVCDVTGGQDSRVLVAALVRASGSGDVGEAVRFRSDLGKADDLAVATHLSEKYALHVNERRGTRALPLTAEESVDTWRRNDLGVYGPVYLPSGVSRDISIGGGGGESHRLFFRGKSIEEMLDRARPEEMSDTVFSRIREAVTDDLHGRDGNLDPRIRFYRSFRDRLHAGRQTVRSVMLAPLASASFREASARMPAARRERGQVIADLMLSLSPELAAEPFDSPKKSFDDRHEADATVVAVAASGPGRVHGGARLDEAREGVRSASREDSVAAFVELFDRTLPRARRAGVLPASWVDAAAETMRGAAEAGRFEHSAKAQPAATVILAGTLAAL